MKKRLNTDEHLELKKFIDSSNYGEQTTEENPFQVNYNKYFDLSRGYVKKTEIHIYDLRVHSSIVPTFQVHLHNLIKSLTEELENKLK